MFKELCGRDNFENVVLVTTMWDEVSEDEGLEREEELVNVFWQSMITLGSSTHRFLFTAKSAWNIINTIPVSPPRERRSLRLQRKMVDGNKTIHKTSARKATVQSIADMFTDIKEFFRRSSKGPKVKKDNHAKSRLAPRRHLIPRSPSSSSVTNRSIPYSSSSTTNRGITYNSSSMANCDCGITCNSSSTTNRSIIYNSPSTTNRGIIYNSSSTTNRGIAYNSSSTTNYAVTYDSSSTTTWSFWTATTTSMSSGSLSEEDYRIALGSVVTTLMLAQSVTELVRIHCVKEAIFPSLCIARALEVTVSHEFIMQDAMKFYHRPWKEHTMHFSGS